jgi:hypothetical protein
MAIAVDNDPYAVRLEAIAKEISYLGLLVHRTFILGLVLVIDV